MSTWILDIYYNLFYCYIVTSHCSTIDYKTIIMQLQQSLHVLAIMEKISHSGINAKPVMRSLIQNETENKLHRAGVSRLLYSIND